MFPQNQTTAPVTETIPEVFAPAAAGGEREKKSGPKLVSSSASFLSPKLLKAGSRCKVRSAAVDLANYFPVLIKRLAPRNGRVKRYLSLE